jgi:hypothetical protein
MSFSEVAKAVLTARSTRKYNYFGSIEFFSLSYKEIFVYIPLGCKSGGNGDNYNVNHSHNHSCSYHYSNDKPSADRGNLAEIYIIL